MISSIPTRCAEESRCWHRAVYQGLGVAGEATYHVSSLDLPTSVALFVERARCTHATFSLTDENAPVIAEICRRLDGIALAIELAAARVKMLGVKQLRDRLDERFRMLTGGGRDALPRQQTLRALIDWSHDLLDERERVLFRRLGIFVSELQQLEGAAAVPEVMRVLSEARRLRRAGVAGR